MRFVLYQGVYMRVRVRLDPYSRCYSQSVNIAVRGKFNVSITTVRLQKINDLDISNVIAALTISMLPLLPPKSPNIHLSKSDLKPVAV